eukprot:TRINITY_DN2022_c0_g1_i1.p1 TRINITY_DN2022_c0_g1~~TRINITY_DN2022_c0_g1_i1.p1  ORF type:complete len:298 (-),score=60.91 TRINITY_DN2022_c0_g1_i1:24-830(-)
MNCVYDSPSNPTFIAYYLQQRFYVKRDSMESITTSLYYEGARFDQFEETFFNSSTLVTYHTIKSYGPCGRFSKALNHTISQLIMPIVNGTNNTAEIDVQLVPVIDLPEGGNASFTPVSGQPVYMVLYLGADSAYSATFEISSNVNSTTPLTISIAGGSDCPDGPNDVFVQSFIFNETLQQSFSIDDMDSGEWWIQIQTWDENPYSINITTSKSYHKRTCDEHGHCKEALNYLGLIGVLSLFLLSFAVIGVILYFGRVKKPDVLALSRA